MDTCAKRWSPGREDGGETPSVQHSSLSEDTVQARGCCGGVRRGGESRGSCIQDGLYSLCFLGTLASEAENTYKSAAIDLLSQTNLSVCHTQGLLTSLRLEAEGAGEIASWEGSLGLMRDGPGQSQRGCDIVRHSQAALPPSQRCNSMALRRPRKKV